MRTATRWYLAIALAPVLVCGVTWPLTATDRWAGLGQWAGAVATVWAVVVALRVFVDESQRTRDEHRDREMSQARLVTVHVEYPNPNESHDAPKVVVMENHSQLPVLLPTVGGFGELGSKGFEWGYDTDIHDYWGPPRVLGAGERDVAPVWFRPREAPDKEMQRHPQFGEPVADPIVVFTDAEGRRWKRCGVKDPERILWND